MQSSFPNAGKVRVYYITSMAKILVLLVMFMIGCASKEQPRPITYEQWEHMQAGEEPMEEPYSSRKDTVDYDKIKENSEWAERIFSPKTKNPK